MKINLLVAAVAATMCVITHINSSLASVSDWSNSAANWKNPGTLSCIDLDDEFRCSLKEKSYTATHNLSVEKNESLIIGSSTNQNYIILKEYSLTNYGTISGFERKAIELSNGAYLENFGAIKNMQILVSGNASISNRNQDLSVNDFNVEIAKNAELTHRVFTNQEIGSLNISPGSAGILNVQINDIQTDAFNLLKKLEQYHYNITALSITNSTITLTENSLALTGKNFFSNTTLALNITEISAGQRISIFHSVENLSWDNLSLSANIDLSDWNYDFILSNDEFYVVFNSKNEPAAPGEPEQPTQPNDPKPDTGIKPEPAPPAPETTLTINGEEYFGDYENTGKITGDGKIILSGELINSGDIDVAIIIERGESATIQNSGTISEKIKVERGAELIQIVKSNSELGSLQIDKSSGAKFGIRIDDADDIIDLSNYMPKASKNSYGSARVSTLSSSYHVVGYPALDLIAINNSTITLNVAPSPAALRLDSITINNATLVLNITNPNIAEVGDFITLFISDDINYGGATVQTNLSNFFSAKLERRGNELGVFIYQNPDWVGTDSALPQQMIDYINGAPEGAAKALLAAAKTPNEWDAVARSIFGKFEASALLLAAAVQRGIGGQTGDLDIGAFSVIASDGHANGAGIGAAKFFNIYYANAGMDYLDGRASGNLIGARFSPEVAVDQWTFAARTGYQYAWFDEDKNSFGIESSNRISIGSAFAGASAEHKFQFMDDITISPIARYTWQKSNVADWKDALFHGAGGLLFSVIDAGAVLEYKTCAVGSCHKLKVHGLVGQDTIGRGAAWNMGGAAAVALDPDFAWLDLGINAERAMGFTAMIANAKIRLKF
ncbi:MAG: hypothetical protein LBB23_00855 [Rickettsiales bacterium]|jgi:hypothetical protein|nr:hypothetical protein [Rickettsiales bacterium]